ncbi:hypothetical protein OHT93_37680 [Streptomyces sp. NBC_00191]|uniref:hypothetical protein n=1 Tax=Streptomyces sp. NBC_00191 TaxID=2975674 RepID=UPI00324DAD4E
MSSSPAEPEGRPASAMTFNLSPAWEKATEVSRMIECRPGARLWGPEDEDSTWQAGIDLFLLNNGNAYDTLACHFGVRNYLGFQPLAEDRGLPQDASDRLRTEFAAPGGPTAACGASWITWAQLASANWQETDPSGTRSRRMVAGNDTHWGPVWNVMRTLSELHGPENVRLVVWFH